MSKLIAIILTGGISAMAFEFSKSFDNSYLGWRSVVLIFAGAVSWGLFDYLWNLDDKKAK